MSGVWAFETSVTCSTNHCPVSIIVASSNHLAQLLKIAPKCPTLKAIVSMEDLTMRERSLLNEWAATVGVEVLVMSELEEWGSQPAQFIEPGPVKGVAGEDELDAQRVSTVSYTSGTTGMFAV